MVEAVQPITPKYKTRMPASIRGDKDSPKDEKKLGTGKTLMSP